MLKKTIRQNSWPPKPAVLNFFTVKVQQYMSVAWDYAHGFVLLSASVERTCALVLVRFYCINIGAERGR